ncbi:Beta-lactamase-related domain containing protein [Aphelenchoides fujianensis]|nr:Beta-lactamase-related domain containing protein [Aphelenchoides fujianensis]
MESNQTITIELPAMRMGEQPTADVHSSASLVLLLSFFFLLAVEVIRRFLSERKPRAYPVFPVEGRCERGFEAVRNAFAENFARGWEPNGAALAVFHRGRLVVDLHGGFADLESRRLWREDTLAVSFSSTKAVSALCVAMLVDRGHVKYETRLAEFWPAFGKHGKDEVTVQDVLSHMAALAWLDQPVRIEDAQNNPEAIARLFEEQTPNWSGKQVGYHALTYGWLVDQIVRRTDPEGRSLGEFYRQEVASKIEGKRMINVYFLFLRSGCDYHIGLPKSEAGRVARLTLPSFRQRVSEYFHNPKAVDYYRFLKDFMFGGLLSRVERNPSWLRFVFEMTLNNPEIYALEQGAVMGIGTARSLAAIFQHAIFGSRFFRHARTLAEFLTPRVFQADIVTGALVERGNGLMHSPFTLGKRKFTMIGHAGVGGQNIKFDPEHELVFCYLSNGLKGGFGDSARTFVALRNAIYSAVVEQEESSA